ncbi:MAG: hypothetical protein JWO71_1716 [Candidatus Acidoferrum typicum]|nr:hypothetical protein [Candidatus Acidoferrum typicum]
MTAEVFSVPVGRTKSGKAVTLCATGLARVKAHAAKVQYRSADGHITIGNLWKHATNVRRIKRVPYIFARFVDPATGKTARPQLGKFLLGASLPVAHKNGDSLDFRLENLEARETERQKARRITAQEKRETRERAAAKRALKPPKEPDGLTPEQQLAVLFDERFQKHLRQMAGAIIRDPLERGTGLKPTDEKRGDEVVSMVMDAAIQPIRNGKVKDVRAYLYTAVLKQAKKERARKWYGMGHVRRPKAESHSLSDIQQREERTEH